MKGHTYPEQPSTDHKRSSAPPCGSPNYRAYRRLDPLLQPQRPMEVDGPLDVDPALRLDSSSSWGGLKVDAFLVAVVGEAGGGGVPAHFVFTDDPSDRLPDGGSTGQASTYNPPARPPPNSIPPLW